MQKNAGFTLIELLVVVLIIGILSAVALPQYQKAVWKARLSQVQIAFNTFQKGIDLWLLGNGFPSDHRSFIGNSGTWIQDSLDIEMPCKKSVGVYCYLDYGAVSANCTPSNCFIQYNNDANINNKTWMKGNLRIKKNAGSDEWILDYVPNENKDQLAMICQWWLATYGKGVASAFAKNTCNSVGISI